MRQLLKPVRFRAGRNSPAQHTSPRSYGIFFLLLFWYAFPTAARSEDLSVVSSPKLSHLTEIARELCNQLHLDDHIEVHIDPRNAKMVSSVPLSGPVAGYVISFDQQFLQTLSEDEIVAAMAHELGHVWIFTHHPFLQTEALANEIALRVVDRATMKKVYVKLWAHTGTPGSFEELLGPDPSEKLPKSATVLP